MKKNIQKIIFIFALLGGLIHLYNSATGAIPPLQMRPLHVGIILVLAILQDIQKSFEGKNKIIRIGLNIVLLIFAVVSLGYFILNYELIVKSAGFTTTEIVVSGTLLVITILIISYRVLGLALPMVASVFILYALFGNYLPDVIAHRGYSFSRTINFLYTNGNGIFGVPVDVATRYLVLFMIMSEFINRSGTDNLFMAVADFIATRTRGGAAKSSVVASALFGSISGTPIANVMVTGAFTIPMMKKSGFPSSMAAAVEATASTGGLIMPPIMGAGAFIMAEVLGVSYGYIMAAALVPAVLYYLSLYLAIDLFALRHSHVKKVSDIQDDSVQRMKKYVHTAIPLIMFIITVMMGYSVFRSAIVTILATPVIAYLRPYTRMTLASIIEGISEGMRKAVMLGAATAAAGIIVGIIALTGFGFSFSEILKLFVDSPMIALLITSVLCIVIGMGMPAVASYLIVATLAAPTLINMGFLPIAAHMFVFYFAAFSSITPPVALATYAASGIAESDPWKSGYQGFILASVAFLVPFLFINYPQLLGQQGLIEVIKILPTALIGIYLYVSGIQGYLFRVLKNPLLRGLLIVAGILFMLPGLESDVIAIVLSVFVYFLNRSIINKDKAMIS